jgi:hypothetical protein
MAASYFKPELVVLESRITPSDVSITGTILGIAPTAGATNALFVSNTETTITLYDEAETFGNIPAGWTKSAGDHQLEGPKGDINWISASLGAEDDFFDGSGSSIGLGIQGGLGDDIIYGGSANDDLNGGEG